jgi:hypothetical protein
MQDADAKRSGEWWSRVGFALVVWGLLALCDAVEAVCTSTARGAPIPWSRALAIGAGLWAPWALLWLFAWWLVKHVPIEGPAWLGRLALHVAAGAGMALVKLGMDHPTVKAFLCPDGTITLLGLYRMALATKFFPYALIAWAMLGVAHALRYHGKYRAGELRASQLEASLARAELHLLKAQLHPHFLFNTLNTISSLVNNDPSRAETMIARLGDLLRLTLDGFGVQEVPLWRELNFTETYLAIEQVRFGPRLRVDIDIEPEMLDALVPYLLLQPLVENALRHGIAPRPGVGRLVIAARRTETGVRLEVADDGRGLPQPLAEGVGLANTRARLRQLYGDAQSLRVEPGAAGGVRVSVDLPLRTAEGPTVGANGESCAGVRSTGASRSNITRRVGAR